MIEIYGLTIFHIDSETGHRTPYVPGMSVDTAPEEVQAAAAKLWTDEAVTAWRESILAENGEPADPRETAKMHMADFRLSLLSNGFLEQVETAMKSPDMPKEAQILWEYATTVNRNDPILNQVKAQLGFTDADLDLVFDINHPQQ